MGAEGLVVELIGAEVKRPGGRIDGDRDLVGVFQRRQDADLHALHGAILDQVGPGGQVGLNFPLAALGRDRLDARMVCTDHSLEVPLVLAVDLAILVVVNQSLVRADDEVLRVPAVQAHHHGRRDGRHVESVMAGVFAALNLILSLLPSSVALSMVTEMASEYFTPSAV